MKVIREFVYADKSTEKYKNKITSGWLLKDKLHFDPIPTGQWRSHVLVHDILEHHPEDGDGVEFEMMAFGATFFIRELGEWKRFRHQLPCGVLDNDFRHFLRINDYKLIDTDGEIHPDLMENYNYIISGIDLKGLDELKDKKYLVDIGFKWISKGYERALERWKAVTSAQVCRLYERLEDELDASRDSPYNTDGGGMTVTFDTVTLKHSIKFHNNEPLNEPMGILTRIWKAL